MSAALGLTLFLTGCKDDRVRVYEVPSERGIASPEAPPVNVPVVEVANGHELVWSVPEAWVAQPVGTMRLASYQGPGGLHIAISKFPGDVGGDLANINRWRRQLNMPPVAALSEVEGLTTCRVPAGAGQLLRLRPSSEPGVASVDVFWMSFLGETWFFKINGTAEALDASEAATEAWLQSIRKP